MNFNDYVQRGIASFQEEKIEQALENFREAQKIQPDNADINQLINMAEEIIRLKTGQSGLKTGSDIKKTAESINNIKDDDKAITEYINLFKNNPNDTSVRDSLASAYYRRGMAVQSNWENDVFNNAVTDEDKHAREFFMKEAAAGCGDLMEKYNKTGSLDYNEITIGLIARAISNYSEAIKFHPEFVFAYSKRGWANIKIGNFDEAIKDFEKMVQLKPDDAQPKQNLASAYMERGIAYDKKRDYINAILDFETVLKFNPDDNTARELLEMAKAEMAK